MLTFNMPHKSEYVNELLEVLEPLGSVYAKAMFGGYGIYKDALMFGLVANNVFYLKVDDLNRTKFEELNLDPFMYTKNGKSIAMSYSKCPQKAFEHPKEMLEWALIGYEAARRNSKKKTK